MFLLPLRDNIPLARVPIITIVLVAINVVAYLLSIRHGGSFFGGPTESVAVHHGAIPYELTHSGSHWDTPFTAMFLHASFLHIFFNMLFLVIFGPNVEDAMSRPRYLVFYLLGGILALAAQVLVDPSSTTPTLGASGAIAAVLGGYALLYPRTRVLTLVVIVFFVTIIEVPALLLLVFWFAEQIVLGAVGLASPLGSTGGVAYFAHIGGFLSGLLLVRLFARRRKLEPPPRPVY